MIYTTKIKSDHRSREILPGNFKEDMFVCIKSSPDRYAHRCIPWHWHSCFEIDYVLQGELELRTAESSCRLRQGDIFFINHSVMHQIQANTEGCIGYSILFDMHFLSGVYNSMLERRYILPIKESDMEYYSFSPDTDVRLAMAQSVLKAVKLMEEEPPGYELLVRSELSSFWLKLIRETQELRGNVRVGNTDKDRIKRMLEYIHLNYADKISVEDIAASADVSERECCRCFTRCVGMSPVKYLTEYRLGIASEMLLDTDATVLDISEACGFSSSSYFGKTFSEAMGCTPREYRVSGGVIDKKG